MNTLKKCILLMVLTINLMPYMQDGNVKWSTMEAGAQQFYTEEVITPGLEWKCGETAHRDDSYYFFISDTICTQRVARPGEEAIDSNNVLDFAPLTQNPCKTEIPTSVYENTSDGMVITYDCIFMIVEALTTRTAKDESLAHPNGINDPANAQGVSSYPKTKKYFESLGLKLTDGPTNEADLILAMSGCNTKIIVSSCDLSTEINNTFIGHIFIINGIEKKDGKFIPYTWDSKYKTENSGVFSVQSGSDYRSISELINGNKTYIVN